MVTSTRTDHSDAPVLSRDPYTGETVYSAAAAGPDEIADAVARSTLAQARWAETPVADRADVLRAFADRVAVNAEALVDLIVREVGKRRADAEGEVAWAVLSARWYADHPPAAERAGSAQVVRRPLGVIAAVTPWNVPLITPAWKWLPALVAGNSVVWKPSDRATATALAAHEQLAAAGVPEDVMLVVPGGAETALSLCGDDRVAAIHFTGSERAGRALAQVAASRLIPVALEMARLNAAVVMADADLDHAADCIVACATALAGQKCTSTRRVFVDSSVRQELETRLDARISVLRLGDPRESATDVGPLIAPEAKAAAETMVAEAVARGARVAARADPADAHPTLFGPVVLAELAPDDPLRSNELFAPVITLETFETLDEASALANESPYGLSAAFYGRDTAVLRRIGERVRAGVVAFNRRGDDVDLEAPFVGHKRSGNGHAEGGMYVYDSVTVLQAVYGD
jgi:acyl-CoA reductase-like NAD-dependent aldehyde dehydrogenase